MNGADRRLLVEAGILLVLARISLKSQPFRRTASLFCLRENSALTPEVSTAPAAAARPAWAVEVAASRMPFKGTCLAQALAGSAMLGRRRIPSIVHLGVAKDPQGKDGLCAHAWLRCGDTVLTGAYGSERFTPLGAFAVGPARAPAEIVERRLAVERRQGAALRGLALQRELVTALQALAADGISEVVVLKGIPLALRVFGSVAEREMRDIDLLVHRREASAALATLTALGYEPYFGLPLDLKRAHALTLQRPTSRGHIYLDLHWTAYHLGHGRVGEELQWRRTEPFAHQGLHCLVFDPAMTIVHLAHHYIVHLEPEVLRDFGAAWNLWHEQVERADLLALARDAEQLDALAVAFERASGAGLLDTSPPWIRTRRAAVVLRLLRGRLEWSKHGRLMITLAGMRPGGRVHWMLHAMFPPMVEMRMIYGDGAPTQVARHYLTRPFELAANVARATKG